MNRKTKIIAAGAACVAALSGVMGIGACAAKSEQSVSAVQQKPAQKAAEPEQNEKNETVYVFAAADGSTDHVVASDWIREQAGDRYENRSADGKLPVAMKVSYLLDGQEIQPKQLAGKSGLLTIRYEFENRQTVTVRENGQSKEVKVPFAAVTGLVLDNDIFSQIQVSGGKLVNDGDRTMVLGLSFPGLKENLPVDSDKLDLPEHLEITARVQNFEMMNTMSLVTSEVFRELDASALDDMDGLTEAADKMTEAMTQLLDGSGQLKNGLATLKEKTGALSDGANQLASGAGQLSTGAGQLSSGLTQLSDNSAALNDGAAKVYETLLNQATAQINAQLKAAGQGEIPALTQANYAQVLNGLISSMGEGPVLEKAKAIASQQINAAIEESLPAITQGVTEAVKLGVTQQVTGQVNTEENKNQILTGVLAQAKPGMTPEQYQQAVEEGLVAQEEQAAVNAAVETQLQSIISQNVDTAMQSEDVQALIAQKIEETKAAKFNEAMNSPEVQSQITAALAQASAGAAAINQAKAGLDSYNQFYLGLTTYTAGVDTAKAGAVKLAEGAGALNSGAGQLTANMPALIDGVNQLYEGSSKLADGLEQFNREGIQKLVDAVDGDLDSLISGLQSSLDAAAGYTGLDEKAGPDSCVKFVFRTEAIH